MVTHRLASAQQADEIVVIAGGRVAERGTHAELLVRSGHYAALWRAQAAGQSPQAEPSAVEARSASSHQ
jgi:ABC-type multidrug transport system fused ATPase/permease subunit